MRGLPGSGKSTLAALLSEKGKYPVLSIDSFFTNEKDEYTFDHKQNHLAYKKCEEDTLHYMKQNCEKIFVDNTFTLDWEIEPYFKLASQFGYAVFVMTLENHHNSKNIHSVSHEQIEKMASKYKVKLY